MGPSPEVTAGLIDVGVMLPSSAVVGVHVIDCRARSIAKVFVAVTD